jgi:hypothetical protein
MRPYEGKVEYSQDSPLSETPNNEPAADLEIISRQIKKMRGRSSSRKSSVSSVNSEKLAKVIEKDAELELPIQKIDEDQENISNSPLDQLIRAAKILNPRQFELPIEMIEHFPFPGTEKVEPPKNGNRKPAKSRKLHELDSQGLVPLPAKVCYTCHKTCKKAPLIACDYCQLLYHQDCLDPPLTALPTGMWMCPNHAEKFIDWKLVSSASATERIKLWNKYGGNVDQDTVKSEFFRKVHRKYPPFRFKVHPKSREIAEVPEMIEYYYSHPISLLPSMKDTLRYNDNVMKKIDTENIRIEDIVQVIDSSVKEFDAAEEKIQSLIEETTAEKVWNT